MQHYSSVFESGRFRYHFKRSEKALGSKKGFANAGFTLFDAKMAQGHNVGLEHFPVPQPVPYDSGFSYDRVNFDFSGRGICSDIQEFITILNDRFH